MNRHDRRAAGITDPFAYRDGKRLVVLRPDDPTIPLAISKEALRDNEELREHGICMRCGGHGSYYTGDYVTPWQSCDHGRSE